MTKGKLQLLSALAMLEATAQKNDDLFLIENPYANISAPSYSASPINTSKHKSNLSKKQKKTRSAAKRAKKARRNNR